MTDPQDQQQIQTSSPSSDLGTPTIESELERLTAFLHTVGHSIETIVQKLFDHAEYLKTHPANPHPNVAPAGPVASNYNEAQGAPTPACQDAVFAPFSLQAGPGLGTIPPETQSLDNEESGSALKAD